MNDDKKPAAQRLTGAVVSKPKHCGACDKKFANSEELFEHLKVCEFAKIGKKQIEDWNDELLNDE